MSGWGSLEAVLEVVDVLEEFGVAHHVGGSLASSVHGVPRQTNDIDLVADLSPAIATVLEARLQDRFYVDAEMILEAIRREGSFNLVHLATGFKVDVFVSGRGAFDRSEIVRHTAHRLDGLDRDLYFKSAEDTILRKLEWYRLGREVSDRQWIDVLGIVRTQGARLDHRYLRRWAQELGVADLLEKALQDAV